MNRDGHWDLYRSLLAVVRNGSLSGAARALRLTQPTIGRHVETLEAVLGAPLFTRSQTGLIPTPAALALVPHAEAMEAAAAALLRAAEGQSGNESGTVRITASEIMGAEVLPPILASIRERHPDIVFELVLANHSNDLLRRDADIAVRMYRPAQDVLVARRIGAILIGLYAHHRYIERRGRPETLAALREHDLIGFDRDDRSFRAVASQGPAVSRDDFSFRVDNDLAQLAALKAGLGIGACQVTIAAKTGVMVPILPEAINFKLDVWLAMHQDQRTVRPIRIVYDALAEGLAAYVAAQEDTAFDGRRTDIDR
jgi:DNA-binding transcriptional LysR family regulator